MKKILIACEYSGIVRQAFERKGFDAISCDILPSDKPGKHYQGNVLDILGDGFDALIAFPPCTYLSSAGLFRCDINFYGQKAIDRIRKRNEAINFFLDLYSADIKHICIENPVGHLNTCVLKPSQIIHPYFFGEKEMKRTCLWLKNLPLLKHSEVDTLFQEKTHTEKPLPTSIDKDGQKRYFTDTLVKNGLKSAHERNKTFQCIADAMANQWSEIINNPK